MAPIYQFRPPFSITQITTTARGGIQYLFRPLWITTIFFGTLMVGWPGGVHDARVFANSAIYAQVTAKQILQGDIQKYVGMIYHHFSS